MTILYQHLLREVLDLAQSSTNDPVLIGLRDGWAVEPTEGSNGG